MMALTLMMALIVGDGQAKSPAHLMAGMPDRGCSGGLAEQAATKAREAFPSPNPGLDIVSNREAYLREHLRELFDPSGTGFLDVDRYAAYEWASILVRIPPGLCTLDFDTFLLVAYGAGADVKATEAGQPYLRKAEYLYFKYMDTGHKGFLDWRDYAKISAQSFRTLDRNHDGRITFAEFFGHTR